MTADNTNTEYDSPPGYYRKYEFEDASITCVAKFAHLVSGTPNRLFTVTAKDVTVGDTNLNPPSTYPDDSRWSELGAFTVSDPETIVYFFDTWTEAARHRIEASLAALELHELTHLLVPEDDNHRDEGHWERWNTILIEEVGWVMDIDDWSERDITPAQPDPESGDEYRQIQLTEVN